MEHTDRWLDVLFGMGDDTHPYWLMAVRVTILLFIVCAGLVAGRDAIRWRERWRPGDVTSAAWALGLTLLAAALRFVVASPNLLDFGGIPYSRLLLGYKGHFATAQVYSLFYNFAGRNIENAILLNQIAGTLTIPLVYVMCRQVWRDPWVARVAAFLFAVSPVHILFSASDALSIFTVFLCAASYVLIAGAVRAPQPDPIAAVRWLGGTLGLVLLTQVRYENALFIAPAVAFALANRDRIAWRSVIGPLGFAAVLLSFCSAAAAAAGLSYQNPVRIWPGIEMMWRHVLWNPLSAAPLLLAGCAAVKMRDGWAAAALAIAPWFAALALPVMAESGHGAMRVYGSWLILLLPAAALGFAALLASPRRAVRTAAVAVLVYLGAQPLLAMATLTSRYLEIREHEFFRTALAELPAGDAVVVVPDDELMRRRHGSTIELFNKYAMTVAGMPEVAGRVRLVRLDDYLADRHRPACGPGGCYFFRGLPCLEQDVYLYTREQCEELAQKRRLVPVAEIEMTAAPFRDCAVYTGRLRDELCGPTIAPQSFGLYRIEDR